MSDMGDAGQHFTDQWDDEPPIGADNDESMWFMLMDYLGDDMLDWWDLKGIEPTPDNPESNWDAIFVGTSSVPLADEYAQELLGRGIPQLDPGEPLILNPQVPPVEASKDADVDAHFSMAQTAADDVASISDPQARDVVSRLLGALYLELDNTKDATARKVQKWIHEVSRGAGLTDE